MGAQLLGRRTLRRAVRTTGLPVLFGWGQRRDDREHARIVAQYQRRAEAEQQQREAASAALRANLRALRARHDTEHVDPWLIGGCRWCNRARQRVLRQMRISAQFRWK